MSAWIPRQSLPGRKRVFFMSCAMDMTKKGARSCPGKNPSLGIPARRKETDAFFVILCCNCCLACTPGRFRSI